MDAATPRSLGGLNALVTGANRGIGLAFVDLLLAGGANRIYAGVREPGDLPDHWRGDERIAPLRLDVTLAQDVAAAADMCRDIDLFVSNAGVTCMGAVLEIEEATAREVMEVNFFGPLALTHALSPALIERKGGIIYVLSMAAMVPPGPAPIYSASKSAAAMMATGIRNALQDQGVTVTLCYPGYVDTRMSAVHKARKVSAVDMAGHTLTEWAKGTGFVFPDPFSQLVLDHMRRDGARFLTDAPRVREEIALEHARTPDEQA